MALPFTSVYTLLVGQLSIHGNFVQCPSWQRNFYRLHALTDRMGYFSMRLHLPLADPGSENGRFCHWIFMSHSYRWIQPLISHMRNPSTDARIDRFMFVVRVRSVRASHPSRIKWSASSRILYCRMPPSRSEYVWIRTMQHRRKKNWK